MRILLDRRWARGLSGFLIGVACAAGARGADVPPSPAEEAEARVDLAERIAELAENTLRLGALTEPAFRESAALLQAAGRVNPAEQRFPRLLVSAESQLQNVDGQIAAWTAYRKLVPDDRDAQQQLIDLYASKMQTADAKLEYLRGLLDKATIPDEVRAHVGAECVALLLDRSREEAIAMVARAKKLYPLPEILNWEYELVGKTSPPPERVKSLLAIIKANPAQPKRVAELANVLASNDLAEAALEWYAVALNLDNRSAQVPSHALAVDYVAELFIANESQAAESVLGRFLQVAPDDPDFWFLKLTLLRGAGEQVALSQTLGLARDAFVRRVVIINDQILGKANSATTVPAIVEAPDPSAAIDSLKAQDRPELRTAFVYALDNLAWFEIYFDQQPDSATPWINALKAMLPADHLTLKRLEGWQDLAASRTKEASAALSPLAGTDPLSALGKIRLDWPDRQAAPSAEVVQLKAKLLSENRTGLIAAILREGLRESAGPGKGPADTAPSAAPPVTVPAAIAPLSVAPAAAPRTDVTVAPSAAEPTTRPASDPIGAELEKFPKELLGILDQPNRFYTLHAEPLRTSIHYSDPLFARVTIKNIGNYDIFIGPAGLLQPHLWFNAQAKGIVTQSYPGVVYDRIANVMVLRPKATASQVIRLDQGELGEALLQRPNGSIIVSGTVLTNPMTLSGGVAIGPGGFAVQFTRNYVRPPSDLHSASSRKKLDEKLASGDPHEKMQALELLAAYVRVLGKEMDATARASANDYLAGIAKARIDSVPEVAAWAQYLVASLPGVEGREQMLRAMVGSTDWQTRLLGVAAVRAQNAELQQQLAAGVAESDPDPVIKRLAAAIIAQLKQSTTQPASNAATAPTAGPATSPSQGPALQPQ